MFPVNGVSMRGHEQRVPDPNSCSNSTDSREEDDKTKIYDILSAILPPEVTLSGLHSGEQTDTCVSFYKLDILRQHEIYSY